jgi:hypothetical protein
MSDRSLTGVYKNMTQGIVALVFRCKITGEISPPRTRPRLSDRPRTLKSRTSPRKPAPSRPRSPQRRPLASSAPPRRRASALVPRPATLAALPRGRYSYDGSERRLSLGLH